MAEKKICYGHNEAVDGKCTGFRPKFLTGLTKFSKKWNPIPHNAAANLCWSSQLSLRIVIVDI